MIGVHVRKWQGGELLVQNMTARGAVAQILVLVLAVHAVHAPVAHTIVRSVHKKR